LFILALLDIHAGLTALRRIGSECVETAER